MLSLSYVPEAWNFDVASLMVLVGEGEERDYRLSQRSVVECIAAAPVIGIQNYIRSYDFLLDGGAMTYYSPYGCKSAPLRNPRLENGIRIRSLLQDGEYNVYNVAREDPRSLMGPYRLLILIWIVFTWMCFAGILVLLLLRDDTTWIGLLNCVTLTGWSITQRLIEHLQIKPARIPTNLISASNKPDAVFILGRRQSAFVLQGTRKQISEWTGRGLTYEGERKNPARTFVIQSATRLVSFLVMVFVFITIPNGSTIDQTAFILVNVLGQANVLVCRMLNGWACIGDLEPEVEAEEIAGDGARKPPATTRTHVYALLLRRFQNGNRNKDWIDVLGILPQTDIWTEWKRRIIDPLPGDPFDAKDLYNLVSSEILGDDVE